MKCLCFLYGSIYYIPFVFLFSNCENFYNTPDPECTGSFGLCTQRDKDTLGYRAIKKIHETIDDDHDGQVELNETKEFMKEELQYKNGFERQQKLHGADTLITVDELWKSWKSSDVHNWTVDDVVYWLIDQVKLPQYSENFRRNKIDGQFLPRLATNENSYYANVLQIKDLRHRNRIMLKSTDLILFGQQQKSNSLIKDIFMFTALTLSLFGCIFAFSKHRQSQELIKKMRNEFDKIGDDEKNLFLFKDESLTNEKLNSIESNKLIMNELNAAKKEAENLKIARESAESQLQRLKLAEKELETVRAALQKTEKQMNLVKYQAPIMLTNLLNKTFESEKELLEFKFKLIDQEKEKCLDLLNKISKRQSGILGALKIAHSSQLEEINSKLELLKCQIQKCKIEKQEWQKRWFSIGELINKNLEGVNWTITETNMLDLSQNDNVQSHNIITTQNSFAQLKMDNNKETIQTDLVQDLTPSQAFLSNNLRTNTILPTDDDLVSLSSLIEEKEIYESIDDTNRTVEQNLLNHISSTFNLDVTPTNIVQKTNDVSLIKNTNYNKTIKDSSLSINDDTSINDIISSKHNSLSPLNKERSKTVGSQLNQLKKILPFIKIKRKSKLK